AGLAAQLRHCLHLEDLAVNLGSDGALAGHAGASDQQADFWARSALPGLARWRADRRWSGGANNQGVVDTDLDFLQSWRREIPFKPSGRLANFIGRFCTEPRQEVCAIATA